MGAGTGRADGFEEQRLAALYDELLPWVYGYFVRRVGGDRGLAEDLTQDTFVSAFRNVPEVIGNERAWITSIARRRLIDHFRRRARRPVVELGVADPPTPAWPPEWTDAECGVLVALGRLRPDHQVALVLHHVDGLSVAEVAEHLARSTGAVESLLARGRKALRRAFQEVEHV